MSAFSGQCHLHDATPNTFPRGKCEHVYVHSQTLSWYHRVTKLLVQYIEKLNII